MYVELDISVDEVFYQISPYDCVNIAEQVWGDEIFDVFMHYDSFQDYLSHEDNISAVSSLVARLLSENRPLLELVNYKVRELNKHAAQDDSD